MGSTKFIKKEIVSYTFVPISFRASHGSKRFYAKKIFSDTLTYISPNCSRPLGAIFKFTCPSQRFQSICKDFRVFFQKSMEVGEIGNSCFQFRSPHVPDSLKMAQFKFFFKDNNHVYTGTAAQEHVHVACIP
jgi:hypothetical protein